MELKDIIIRPVQTEKSMKLRDSQNKYVFIVHKDANKIQVADAVKSVFSVTPLNVNMIKMKGKKKRVRYKFGYRPSYKKAIVSLKEGDKIAIFEGA